MTKFTLKIRQSDAIIELTVQLLKRLLSDSNPATLRSFFRDIADQEEIEVHDITWWKRVLNWIPPYDQRTGEGGITNEEGYLWHRIAQKILDFDLEKDEYIILEPFQVDLFWNRLKDKRFKLLSRSMAYFNWLEEWKNSAGKHFESEDPSGTEGSLPRKEAEK